jgi:hypothetical protein
MEVRNIERVKKIQIDVNNKKITLTYDVKMITLIRYKEIIFSEKFSREIRINYDINDIKIIENTMNELAKEVEEYIEKIKKFVGALEFIAESHGYEII